MLYKKNSALELNNYRRIGLEMTVYKLWTRMVTFAMADRAERQGMLSASQAGFRSKRSTAQQIELMVMALEDAYWFKNDVYLLQADMTEAFDTISHDKLLCVLYDLGFPTDAIEVVKDLYMSAHTKIKTPYGSTPEIPIDRGTIQGDSLSPFLFVLYMEPLLRFLHAGGHAYAPSALKQSPIGLSAKTMSSITYADDLNLLTGGRTALTDLKRQASKVDAYTTWGHLVVNNTKTTVTGALYHTQPHKPYDLDRLREQLEGAIRMQGKPITFHHPKDPFRHLGVLLTMDLNYKAQFQATLTYLSEAAHSMKQSRASCAQKMRTLRTSLRPAVAYVLTVAPFSQAELSRLDGVLTRMAKQAHGLAVSMPRYAAHEDTAKGGLGCPSIAVEQTTISIQRLTRSLNDKGTLGHMTRGLLQHQQHAASALSVAKLPQVARYCMRLRQAMALKAADMVMQKEGHPSLQLGSMSSLAQGLAQTLSTDSKWEARMVEDIHMLYEVGVTSIENMLSADRQTVLAESALGLLVAKRKVRAKHKSAWARIMHYLHTGQVWEEKGSPPDCYDRPLPLLSSFYRNMKERWPSNPTAWKTGAQQGSMTGIHSLIQMHHRRDSQALTARDEVAQYVMKLASNEQLAANTSYRDTVEYETNPVNRHTKTGHAQYRDLMAPVSRTTRRGRRQPTLTNEQRELLVALGDQHSHTTERITGIAGLCNSYDQQQARVQWGPCVQPGWQIEIQKQQQGYHTKEVHIATSQDLREFGLDIWRPCEYCTSQAMLRAKDTRQCTVCARAYHTACIEKVEATKSDSQPYTCRECSLSGHTSAPEEVKLYRVEWAVKEEAIDNVRRWATEEALRQLEEALTEQLAKQGRPAEMPKRCDTSRSAVMPHPDERMYDITIGDPIRKKLIIHTDPFDPHLDVAPLDRRRAYVRDVPHLDAQGNHTNTEMCVVYGKDGRSAFRVTAAIAARLKAAFDIVRARHPEIHARFQVESFDDELYRLAVRYQHEGTTLADKCKFWGLPAELVHTIMAATQATTEVHGHALTLAPCTACWHSLHPRDQVVGSSGHPYGVRWTGSVLAIPEFDIHEATRTVDWAIRSVRAATTATLIMVIAIVNHATDDDTPYMQLLRRNQDVCLPVCTFSRDAIKLQPPANMPLAEGVTLKWKFRLVAIGNVEGFRQHCPLNDSTWRTNFELSVSSCLPRPDKGRAVTFEKLGDWRQMWAESASDPAQRWQRKASNRFRRRPVGDNTQMVIPIPEYQPHAIRELKYPGLTPNSASMLDIDVNAPLEFDELTYGHTALIEKFKADQGLLPDVIHDASNYMFSDGSKQQGTPDDAPGIGAAVYNPRTDHATTIHVAWEGEGADAKSNTIQRAELAGIVVALKNGDECRWPDGSVHIATDSLASIYALAKNLRRPQDTGEHTHLNILQQFKQLLRDAPGKVHVHKVKAHIGIIGNELADLAAKAVATGHTIAEEIFATPSHNRSATHWPHKVHVHTNDKGQTTKTITPLRDLGDTLKQQAHTHGKYGQAKTDGVYVDAWKRADASIHHDMSHIFMTTRKVRFRARKKVLQYRWGLLPTARWLHKIGKSPTNTCPLCGGEDGGHHVLSGCPRLSPAFTDRHNAAGTELAEAVGKGDLGHCVWMTDVGWARRRSRAEIPEQVQLNRFMQNVTFPYWVPYQLVNALTAYKESVPDMLLVQSVDEGTNYILVELKYCRDTDRIGQQERAAAQHQALKTLISNHDPLAGVVQVTITLGVSGVIYKDFFEDMRKLGVYGAAATALAKRLHLLAVEHVEKIWALRTHLLQGSRSRLASDRKRGTYRKLGRATKARTGRTTTAASHSRHDKRTAGSLEPDHRKKRRTR
jgi:ribonuclease HI